MTLKFNELGAFLRGNILARQPNLVRICAKPRKSPLDILKKFGHDPG